MANTSQDSDSSQLQPVTAILGPVKAPRSNKAPSVKAAVLVQRASGVPKRKIARDLGVSRPTVDVIIAEANLDQQLESGQLLSSTLIPKAVQAVEKTLDKGDGVLGLNFLKWQLGENPNSKNGQQQALNAVFSGCQVLIQQATASTLHKDAAEPSTNNDQPIAQVADSKQDKP